ncbi:unnamed protein product, partial [Allacma fusca]
LCSLCADVLTFIREVDISNLNFPDFWSIAAFRIQSAGHSISKGQKEQGRDFCGQHKVTSVEQDTGKRRMVLLYYQLKK